MPKNETIRRKDSLGPVETGASSWLLNVSLVVLGSFVAGVIVANFRFDDPRPLHNAVTWVGTLGVTMALLALAAARFGQRIVPRMQLGVLLSLIAHLLLVTYLATEALTVRGIPEAAELAEVSQERAQQIVLWQETPIPLIEPVTPEHEQPVETQTPDSPAAEIRPQEMSASESLAKPEPAVLPEQKPTIEPHTVSLARVEQAASRQSIEASQLSRNSSPTMPVASQPVAVPEMSAPAEQHAQAAPSATPLTRRATAVQTPSQLTERPSASFEVQPQSFAARRTDQQEPSAAASNSPTPARQTARPAELPRSTVAAAQPLARVEAAPGSQLQASIDSVDRTAAGPRVAQTGSAPIAEQGSTSNLPLLERRVTGDEPRLAGTSGQSPTRRGSAAAMALVRAEQPQLPTTGQSAQTAGRAAPDVRRDAPIRRLAGVDGQLVNVPAGAPEAERTTNASPGSSGAVRLSRSDGLEMDSPRMTQSTSGGALRRGAPAASSGTKAPLEVLGAASAPAASGKQDPRDMSLGSIADSAAPARQTGSVQVKVAAVEGLGGLGPTPAAQVGSLARVAQPDAPIVHLDQGRFLRRSVGGPLSIDGRVRDRTDAFDRRNRDGENGKIAGSGLPSRQTEAAIELGLDFLARHQESDGSWSLHDFTGHTAEDAGMIQADTAATGLALLAFLGAGYGHLDEKYQHVVRNGIDFLLKNQKANGDLYFAQDPESNKGAWLYSHALASIVLCEAYGMTGDPSLRMPAQRSLDFIASTQNPTQGGWRYVPRQESDTSVTGWMLMALKSGELAGLSVSRDCLNKVRKWLDTAQAPGTNGSQYVYNPNAADTQEQRHGRGTSLSNTAVGLLMRLYLGWNREQPAMVHGADHLLSNLPDPGTRSDHKRDTYYWYYATQVMFHMGGKYWNEWNGRLHPLLVDSQVQTGRLAGSWHPMQPVPDKWGPQGGRIYVTTLNLLSLEVYYRHLPLYEATR